MQQASVQTGSAEKSDKSWKLLSGLALSGFLLGLPGGLLPVWDYHIHLAFGIAGNLFLAIGLGALAGSALGRRVESRFSPAQILSAGCILACLSLIGVAFCGRAAPAWVEGLVLASAGISSGIVNVAVLGAITPWYERDPAGTSLLAGSYFGAGSFAAALLLAEALSSRTPSRWIILAASLPAAAAFGYSRLSVRATVIHEQVRSRALEQLRSGVAVLFALLLFFQFGSEWALAGWLPIYLIDRLGFSPSNAVLMQALYWFAITAGRLAVTRLLPRVPHGKVLAAGAFCALFGCVVLVAATNFFGVLSALALTGLGFSSIYPLCAERIGQRFSYYHPAYFNGIFSFALVGAMISPWALGHLASDATLQVVPLATMLSSCAVFLLILLIWLGRKVLGD